MITTDKQVRRLLKLSKRGLPLVTLADRAGMDVKTARKYLESRRLPSQLKKARDWRTRQDSFVEVWPEVEGLLKETPSLQALTLFEDLQRRYPGKFPDGQLRTLQRRIRTWRALYGPEQEVFFPQIHRPGRVGQSDFTWMNSLNVTIAGQSFPHLLYHFVLTYSNWEYGEVCFSESFESLSGGLQNALWEAGGVPSEHRTDHLGAATFGGLEAEDFGSHYLALMRHYGMTPTKNNAGSSHENGDVEQSHYRIKEKIDQALLLRGSRDFSTRSEYARFVRDIFAVRNHNRRKKVEEELAGLKSLPAYRLNDYREYRVPVSTWSTIRVAHNTYSVPSRLIRHEVTARLHSDLVEVHFADHCICSMERLRGTGKASINYRHVIGSLVRKPGAFVNYRYREEMFPSTVYRQAYDWLLEHDPSHASRRYIDVLDWAATNSEGAMEAALRELLDSGDDLCIKRLISMAESPLEEPFEIEIPAPDLLVYDSLLQGVSA